MENKHEFYPRWINHEGNQILVNDHLHHSGIVGIEYDERAQPVQKEEPVPPTVETVLAAGYSKEAAEQMSAIEQFKKDNGIEPYGDKPASQFEKELQELVSKFIAVSTPTTSEPAAPAASSTADPEPAPAITAEELFGKGE